MPIHSNQNSGVYSVKQIHWMDLCLGQEACTEPWDPSLVRARGNQGAAEPLCSTGRCPVPVPSAQLPEAAAQGMSEEQCWMLSKCFLSCPIAAIQRWHCSVREHCVLVVMGQCSDSCCCPPPLTETPPASPWRVQKGSQCGASDSASLLSCCTYQVLNRNNTRCKAKSVEEKGILYFVICGFSKQSCLTRNRVQWSVHLQEKENIT